MVYKKQFDDEEQVDSGTQDFAQMLEESFQKKTRKLQVGDKVRAEVLTVGKDSVIVDTSPHDGFVPRSEFEGADEAVTVKRGDMLDLYVTQVRGSEIHLSLSPTTKNLADNLAEAFQNDSLVEGRVEEVTKGGFRVLVMGKLAFCPISQLDSKRIEAPELYVGKRYQFHVTQFSEGGRNIVVSRRRLLAEESGQAQDVFVKKTQPGDVVSGAVTRLESFGAFIEIAPGIEGLAHISELSWSRVAHPKDVLEVGQVVSAKILKVETEGTRLKISLSLKQSEQEPWQNLPSDVQEGKILSGKVTRCMKFGAFVELFPGIEGLIPLSEMSYSKRVARSDELIKEGEVVRVLVKEVNPQAKRISLSLRDGDPNAVANAQAVGKTSKAQSEDNDWKSYQSTKPANDGLLGAAFQNAMNKGKKKS